MSRSSSKAPTGVQPWHVVVFVLAAALVVWQLSRVVGTARANADYKIVKGDNAAKGPVQPPENPNQPPPLSNASQNVLNNSIKDKDSDSDD